MTKPDLMAELAAYELVMVSGVSPQNNVIYGFFATREQAELVGGFLMDADAQNHPEWSSYTVTHHAELEAVVRDAARYRWLRESEAMLWKDGDSHPVDFDLDTAIDAQMHNSAREWL